MYVLVVQLLANMTDDNELHGSECGVYEYLLFICLLSMMHPSPADSINICHWVIIMSQGRAVTGIRHSPKHALQPKQSLHSLHVRCSES